MKKDSLWAASCAGYRPPADPEDRWTLTPSGRYRLGIGHNDTHAGALEYGRRLVAEKISAGLWIAPKTP
jgi:hypothetical protein